MEELVAAASDHAEALRRQPGCLAAYVLTERGGSSQISLSIFESEESLSRAMEATRSVIVAHDIPRLVHGTPVFRMLDVRWPPAVD